MAGGGRAEASRPVRKGEFGETSNNWVQELLGLLPFDVILYVRVSAMKGKRSMRMVK